MGNYFLPSRVPPHSTEKEASMLKPRPILAGAVLAVCSSPAFAALALATAPLPVVPGQQLTLCAVNVGRHKAKVTLKFINVHTGAIAAQKDLILTSAGP